MGMRSPRGRGAWDPRGNVPEAAGAREEVANGEMANQGQVSHGGSSSGDRPGGHVPPSHGQAPCHLSAQLPRGGDRARIS